MNLTEWIRNAEDEHLSEFLRENCFIEFEGLDQEQKVQALTLYQEMVDLVQKRGWHEHTADWDLYTEMEWENDNNAGSLSSESGYPDIGLIVRDGEKLVIKAPSEITACVDYRDVIGIEIVIETDGKGGRMTVSTNIDEIIRISLIR